MNYYIDIQHACDAPLPFSDETIKHWVTLTLLPHKNSAELTLRFVDAPEMTELNHTYRKQNKVTNVLAFPSSYPAEIELDYPLLGDVIICPSVLLDESQQLETPLEAHWAHIVIHGVLHLLGYDHIIESDALIMRPLEIDVLAKLGFDNPYKTEEDNLE
jgi:probable rRNA maturation factor